MKSGMLPGLDGAMGYEVEMFFSCKNLKDLDTFGKSDPFITVAISEGKQTNPPKHTWTSEIIKDELNPTFKKTLIVMYKFEMNQYVKLCVYDDDEKGKKELIGEVNTTLGNIVGSKDFLFKSQLTDPSNPKDTKRGEITIKI